MPSLPSTILKNLSSLTDEIFKRLNLSAAVDNLSKHLKEMYVQIIAAKYFLSSKPESIYFERKKKEITNPKINMPELKALSFTSKLVNENSPFLQANPSENECLGDWKVIAKEVEIFEAVA